MGPSNGVKKPSENAERNVGGEGVTESKVAGNPKFNGNEVRESPPVTDTKEEAIMVEAEAENGQEKTDVPVRDSSKVSPANDTDPTPEKPDTATKTGNGRTEKLDTNDEEHKLQASKPADESRDLGAILKGAPFEQEAGQKSNAPQEQEPSLSNNASSAPKKTGSKPGKISLQPKSTSHPSAISTKKIPSKATKAAGTTSKGLSNGPSKTPNSPTVAGSPAPLKPASPRQPLHHKPAAPSGEPKKEPAKKKSRISVGPKVPGVAAIKPGKGTTTGDENSEKKPGLPSPTTKLRPKSPTRPARLPAAATATTASSAAKLGDAVPTRSPSRASVAHAGKSSVLGRDRAAPSANPRKPSSRPSLPAPLNPTQKPKSRVSMASAKAPEGSFLARMMRPTQSSASKTHEKVDHPPVTKSHNVKPKRKSEGSDEGAKTSESEEPPATSEQEENQAPAHETTAEPAEEPVNGTEVSPAEATFGN